MYALRMRRCSCSGGPRSSAGNLTETEGSSVRFLVASHGSKFRCFPNTFPTLYEVHSAPNRTLWKSSTTRLSGLPA